MPKAKKSKSKNKPEAPAGRRAAFAEALVDIKRELGVLESERINAERQLRTARTELQKTKVALNITQSQELSLRDKLSALINKETQLTLKREKLEEKLDEVKEKVGRVRKIEGELEEI